MRYRYIEIACFVHIFILLATPASAGPKSHDTVPVEQGRCHEHPWFCGVSEDQQQRALALYKEGNLHFNDSLFVAAVAKYRAALELWDHPGIHYSLALALKALERYTEAYESIVAALRYGPAALRPEDYKLAREYQKILRGRVAELEVTCDESGAVVTLDGELLFHAPGTVQRFVLPGHHELVAKKSGYLTSHRTLLLLPDKPLRAHMALLPSAEAMITTRHWEPRRPWAVVGAGVGVGLLGTALEWRASVNNRNFQRLFADECPPPAGCPKSSYSGAMRATHWRSTWYRRLGHGASIVGATAAVTGLVLVAINRPQQQENPVRRRLIRVTVTPAVQPESATMNLRVDF